MASRRFGCRGTARVDDLADPDPARVHHPRSGQGTEQTWKRFVAASANEMWQTDATHTPNSLMEPSRRRQHHRRPLPEPVSGHTPLTDQPQEPTPGTCSSKPLAPTASRRGSSPTTVHRSPRSCSPTTSQHSRSTPPTAGRSTPRPAGKSNGSTRPSRNGSQPDPNPTRSPSSNTSSTRSSTSTTTTGPPRHRPGYPRRRLRHGTQDPTRHLLDPRPDHTASQHRRPLRQSRDPRSRIDHHRSRLPPARSPPPSAPETTPTSSSTTNSHGHSPSTPPDDHNPSTNRPGKPT